MTGRRHWRVLPGFGQAAAVCLTDHPSPEACEAISRSDPTIGGEAWLLRPVAGLPFRPLPTRPITELRILSVFNSAQAGHCADVEALILPGLLASGGTMSAQYEITIGPARPTIVTFTGWDSLAHLHQGRQMVDASAGMARKRARDLDRYGRISDETLRTLILQDDGAGA